MDFPKSLQSRASTAAADAAYIPPHRTQVHPRMRSAFSPLLPPPQPPPSQNPIRHQKCLILTAFLFTLPFLFYLLSTASKIHHSPKYSEPDPRTFGVVIHFTIASSRVYVFELLGEGQLPFVESMRVPLGSAAENVVGQVEQLVDFAKRVVPRKEWGKCKVQLVADDGGGETEDLEVGVGQRFLEEGRRLLRASGFSFKDDWARLIRGDCCNFGYLIRFSFCNAG